MSFAVSSGPVCWCCFLQVWLYFRLIPTPLRFVISFVSRKWVTHLYMATTPFWWSFHEMKIEELVIDATHSSSHAPKEISCSLPQAVNPVRKSFASRDAWRSRAKAGEDPPSQACMRPLYTYLHSFAYYVGVTFYLVVHICYGAARMTGVECLVERHPTTT